MTQFSDGAAMPMDLLLTCYEDVDAVLLQSLSENVAAAAMVNAQPMIDGVLRNDSQDPQSVTHQGWGLVVAEMLAARLLRRCKSVCTIGGITLAPAQDRWRDVDQSV